MSWDGMEVWFTVAPKQCVRVLTVETYERDLIWKRGFH